MASLIKLAIVILCSALGHRYIRSEFIVFTRDIKDLVKRQYNRRLVLFCAVFSVEIALVAATPFLHGTLLRTLLVIYLSLSAVAAVIHRNITGQYAHDRAYFDEETTEILLRELEMALEAFVGYRRDIMSAAVPGAIIASVLIMPPSSEFQLADGFGYTLIILTALIAVCYRREWIFIHGKGWPLSFPSIVMIPIKCIIAITSKEALPHVKLSPVTITHERKPLNKIVFIMDESIRGDYTTLGNPAIDTTPYLTGLGDVLANFGVAVSGHNCSSYSRYILRHGARPEQLPQALANGLSLPGPTIWQYAKSAGLRTVYIDGFSNYLRLHSGMSLRETSLIDEYVKIPPAEPRDRDVRVSECLRQALADPAPAFIYVDKHGIHVPYDDKYPPDYAAYEIPPDASHTEKYVTTYKSAVRWNVDEFFRRVLANLDLSQTAIIYTSDHGQSLLEGGYSASHCSVGPNIVTGEALVPLFAIVGDAALRNELNKASKIMLHKASHFEIFPTLLMAFGFARSEVRTRYGAGLSGEPAPSRRFLAGFKSSATWVQV